MQLTTSVWAWLASSAILFVAEMLTGGLFMLPFAIGAAVAVGLAASGVPSIWQWLAFFGVSIAALAALHPLARRTARIPAYPAGTDRLLGREAVVTEPISPSGSGCVRVGGESWSAIALGMRDISTGSHVVVERVEGARLVVRPASGGER